MKNSRTVLGVLFTFFAVGAIHAENEAGSLSKPQVVAHDAIQKGSEAVIVTLDADEQAFAAKLNDQNRKVFSHRLNTDQRRAVLIAVENGTDPDEAVHRMAIALEIREKSVLAQTESENTPLVPH